MENQQICPVCQTPMKWIPAGVSKRTGKSYNGFWSCPNRCPKAGQTSPVNNQVRARVDEKSQDEKWAKIRAEKNNNIRWMNALNNACLIIAHSGMTPTKTSIYGFAYGFANWIYGLEPNQDEQIDEPNYPEAGGHTEDTLIEPPF